MWEIKKRHGVIALFYLIIFSYLLLSNTYLIHRLSKNFFPDFYPVITFISFLFLGFTLNIFMARSLIHPFLSEGEHEVMSLNGILFGIQAMTNSVFLYPLQMNSPSVFKKIIYTVVGIKCGKNSQLHCFISDPYLVEIGNNFKSGFNCGIVSHNIKSGTISLNRIKIGHNVSLGDNVIVYPGAKIGDNVFIQSKSILKQGTIIPNGQVWGGVPAKFMKKLI